MSKNHQFYSAIQSIWESMKAHSPSKSFAVVNEAKVLSMTNEGSWGSLALGGLSDDSGGFIGSFQSQTVSRKNDFLELNKKDALRLLQEFQEHDFGISIDKELHVPVERLLPPPEEETQLRAVASAAERVGELENDLLTALSAPTQQIDQIWATVRELVMFVSKCPMTYELGEAIPNVITTIITLWLEEKLPANIPSPSQAVAFFQEHRLMTRRSWQESFDRVVQHVARTLLSPSNAQVPMENTSSKASLTELLNLWRLRLARREKHEELWFHRDRDLGPVALWEGLPEIFAQRSANPGQRGSLVEQLSVVLPNYIKGSLQEVEMGDHFLTTLFLLSRVMQSRSIDLGSQRLSDIGSQEPDKGLSPDERSFLTFAALVATGSPPRSPLRHTDLNMDWLLVDVKTQMARSIYEFVSKASVILPNLLTDAFVPGLRDETIPANTFFARNPNWREVDSYLNELYCEERVLERLEGRVPAPQVEWAIRETSRDISEPLRFRVQQVFTNLFYKRRFTRAMVLWRAFRNMLQHQTSFWGSTLKKLRYLQLTNLHERLWTEMERCHRSPSHKMYSERFDHLVRKGQTRRAAQAFILLLRRAENAKSLLEEYGSISKEQENSLNVMQKSPLSRDFLLLLVTEGEDRAAFELFRLLQNSTYVQFSPGASLSYLLLDCALKSGLSDEANMITQELRGAGVRLRQEQASAIFAADMLSWREDLSLPTIKHRLTQALTLVFPNATWPDPDVPVPQTMNISDRMMLALKSAYATFLDQTVGYCDSKFDTTKFVLAVYDHALTVTGIAYHDELYSKIQKVFSDQISQAPRLGMMLARDTMPGVSRRRDTGADYLLSFYLSDKGDNRVKELRNQLQQSNQGRQVMRELSNKKLGFQLSETRIWDLMPMSMGRKAPGQNFETPSQFDDLSDAKALEDLAWEDHERTLNQTAFEAQTLTSELGDLEGGEEEPPKEDKSDFGVLGLANPSLSENTPSSDSTREALSKQHEPLQREPQSDLSESASSGMQELLAFADPPRKRAGSRKKDPANFYGPTLSSVYAASNSQRIRDLTQRHPRDTQSPPPVAASNPRMTRVNAKDGSAKADWTVEPLNTPATEDLAWAEEGSGDADLTQPEGLLESHFPHEIFDWLGHDDYGDTYRATPMRQDLKNRGRESQVKNKRDNVPRDQRSGLEHAPAIQDAGDEMDQSFEPEKAAAGGSG
ncbi:MAG: hypothetical protein Q9160_007977 [Pyrenula sp. 1 TL-2023]